MLVVLSQAPTVAPRNFQPRQGCQARQQVDPALHLPMMHTMHAVLENGVPWLQVACNVATGPRPQLTTFKNNKPVSVDMRDEGSESKCVLSRSHQLFLGSGKPTDELSPRVQARGCSPAPTLRAAVLSQRMWAHAPW